MIARPTTRAPRARGVVLACALTTALTGGCTSVAKPSASPETTVTITQPSTSSASSPSGSTQISDVIGRRFDLGQIQSVRTVDGTLVVELDRWTVPGTSDSKLSQEGLPVRPHREQLYVNKDTGNTYTAPVAPQAQFVLNTCVPANEGPDGLISTPRLAADWLKHPSTSALLLVTYDDQGRITRLDTDPRC